MGHLPGRVKPVSFDLPGGGGTHISISYAPFFRGNLRTVPVSRLMIAPPVLANITNLLPSHSSPTLSSGRVTGAICQRVSVHTPSFDLIGITCSADLEHCALVDLVFWARVITAHGACLRAVEHSAGMQLRDFETRRTAGGVLAFLTVGRRRRERKLKHKRRVVPLCCSACITSAGHVLRVLRRRLHKGADGRDTLFPDLTAARFTGRVRPWAKDLRRLQRLCLRAGLVGNYTARSLRAGGTTDLFSVGATVQFVKHQGGWKSYTFTKYDRPTPATRVFLASKYAKRLRSLLSAHTL